MEHTHKTQWESLIGGRVLNAAGLLLIFLGTVFFLKTAFHNGWVPPGPRIAMGLVSGALVMAYGQFLFAKRKVYFSEGLTALGAGIEFLSIYASSALFHLAKPGEAMVGMIAVTAVIATLAWRQHSTRLGALAAIGGFATPVLAGTQSTDPWVLCAYLFVLDAGLLALATTLKTRVIAPIALVATLLYALGIFPTAPQLNDLERAAMYAVLYLPFAVSSWLGARSDRRDVVNIAIGSVAFCALVAGVETSLRIDHRAILATCLLGLSVWHAGVAIATRTRYNSWLSAVALTLAIPAAFHGAAVNVGWAAEAAVLSIAGLRYRDDVLRCAGIALLGFGIVRDFGLYSTYTAAHPILNGRFVSGLATIAATYAIAFSSERMGTSAIEALLVRALRTSAHAMIVALVSLEAWDAANAFAGTHQAASSALSVCWAAIAASFIGWGLFRRDAFLRWEGLGLVSATAVKVLVLDLAFLDLSYRVVSAIFVGVAMLAISYGYQRYVARSEETLV